MKSRRWSTGLFLSGSAFSSLLPWVWRWEGERSSAPEPLDTTVDRQGRLWRTRMTLISGVPLVLGAELDLRMVSLESPEERCVLTVFDRDIAGSRRFLWRELVADGGRACGVRDISWRWAETRLLYELFREMEGISGVSPRSSLCMTCLVLSCRCRLSSTRLLAPLPLRLLFDARSLPAMTLALGGGWSIHLLSAGSGDGRLTTGGCSSLTGGARTE